MLKTGYRKLSGKDVTCKWTSLVCGVQDREGVNIMGSFFETLWYWPEKFKGCV